MPESLAAFHARVDGFMSDSLPRAGGLVTREQLRDKVAPDGTLRPFHGNTVIWELDDASKLALSQRQVTLHHHAGGCLAAPLAPQTFHITLHDLENSPDEALAAAAVARTQDAAIALLDALKGEGLRPVRMVSTHVFSMVDTSIVTGFAPETEEDCAALMALYERFHAIRPLDWALTPHATLCYYCPGRYDEAAVEALKCAIRETDRLPPIRLTLTPERLVYRRFSDMDHYF